MQCDGVMLGLAALAYLKVCFIVSIGAYSQVSVRRIGGMKKQMKTSALARGKVDGQIQVAIFHSPSTRPLRT